MEEAPVSDDGEHGANAHARSLVGLTLKAKWRLDSLIGVGGMAAVFAATHRNGDRVAVKILHPYVAVNPSLRQRFLREGYTANSVGHPGVVRVQDDDALEDGSVFLVMELLTGESAEARWKKHRNRMPALEVLSIAEQTLDVLAAAHEKGILHRDIKPDNIFITAGDKVKILDFGIAKVREAASGGAQAVTRTGTMMGTPAYMPPEQVMAKDVDQTSDLWAVGATMFTLLTGRFVHPAETINEQLVLAATEAAPPFASVVPNAPEALAELLDRALAFRKHDRWPDGATMREAVLAVMETLRAEQPGWAPKLDGVAAVGFAPTVDSNPSGAGAVVSSRTPRGSTGGRSNPNQGTISAATLNARISGGSSDENAAAAPTGRKRLPLLLAVTAVALIGVVAAVALRGAPSPSGNALPPTTHSELPAAATQTPEATPPSTVTVAPVVAPSPPESASGAKPPVVKPGLGVGGPLVPGKPPPSAPVTARPPKPDGPDIFDKR